MTQVPGSTRCRTWLPSPNALTVSRRRVSLRGAGREKGWAVSQLSGVRKRHRKNCPASAASSSRRSPVISMLTTPGGFGDDSGDAETMTGRLAQRCEDTVADEQGEHLRVEQRPGQL